MKKSLTRPKGATAYKINKGFIVQRLDNKITIFDGEESLLYSFNETASFILSKLKPGWEEKEILKALVKRYGIKEKRAQEDLNDLIKRLSQKENYQGMI